MAKTDDSHVDNHLVPQEEDARTFVAAATADLRSAFSGERKLSAKEIHELVSRLAETPLLAGEAHATRCDVLLDGLRCFYYLGSPTEALPHFPAVRRWAEADSRIASLARLLSLEGICLADRGDLVRALHAYAQAIPLAQQSGDMSLPSNATGNCAAALLYAGLYDEAERGFHHAIQLAPTLPHDSNDLRVGIAHLHNISLCQYNKGSFAAAAEWAAAAIHAAAPEPRTTAERHHLLASHKQHVMASLALGDLPSARIQLEKLQSLTQGDGGLNSPRSNVQVLLAQGAYAVRDGRAEEGLRDIAEAIRLAAHMPPMAWAAYDVMVKAHQYLGNNAEAAQYLRAMMESRRGHAERRVATVVNAHLAQLGSAFATPQSAPTPVDGNGDGDGGAGQRELQQKQLPLFRARMAAVERLAVSAKLIDDADGQSPYRVARLSRLIAEEAGMSLDYAATLEATALSYDIGKLALPGHILAKSAPLTGPERNVAEQHAAIGEDMLRRTGIEGADLAAEIARSHHERWDGQGYPDRLAGEAIPVSARIVGLADAFDALTHARPYKSAWSINAALAEIHALKGLYYDPSLTDALLRVIARLRAEANSQIPLADGASHIDAILGEGSLASMYYAARATLAKSLGLACRGFVNAANGCLAARQVGEMRFVAPGQHAVIQNRPLLSGNK